MKYKKNIILILAMLVFSVNMSGCSKQKEKDDVPSIIEDTKEVEQNQAETTEDTGNQFPEIYEQSNSENVIFNTKIVVQEDINKIELKEGRAFGQSVNRDKAYEVLFSNNIVKNEYESGGQKTYIAEDGDTLSIDGSTIQFASKLASYIMNSFRLEDNTEKFEVDKDLEFQNREDAFVKIKEFLGNIGYDVSGEFEYQCYALDYHTLQQEELITDHDGNIDESKYNPEWSKEDECYYFSIRQKFSGIPEYHPYYGAFKSAKMENAPIQMMYSKNGIEYVNIEKVFSYESTEEEIKLKEFKDIANTIEQKYGMLLTNTVYTVNTATLHMMSQKVKGNEYQITPVWVVDITETTNGDNENDKKSFQLVSVINAKTGEEIPMEDKS